MFRNLKLAIKALYIINSIQLRLTNVLKNYQKANEIYKMKTNCFCYLNMHLGSKIKLARVYKGYTQLQLADKVGRTRALLSHIEQTGKANHYTVTLICKALKISIEELEDVDKKQIFIKPKNQLEVEILTLEVEQLKKEMVLLKEILESKNKIIALYETKNKNK